MDWQKVADALHAKFMENLNEASTALDNNNEPLHSRLMSEGRIYAAFAASIRAGLEMNSL